MLRSAGLPQEGARDEAVVEVAFRDRVSPAPSHNLGHASERSPAAPRRSAAHL